MRNTENISHIELGFVRKQLQIRGGKFSDGCLRNIKTLSRISPIKCNVFGGRTPKTLYNFM